uniref:NADH dehydrogenase subunit 4L n=3 Tax=Contracaecum TaxID=47567 RepID=E6YBG4_CONRU|nr:NADH dehydrogenase subunit 4L [Contracaecum rudolphii B Bullini et al., 1986]YP_009312575.1 NADH dehydrogenase subunit 4L [Contracaecum ogmorhini sensu lato Australia]YP_009312587.1 NADH dehydrogenase subunit 4L [Contracaecum ogmorhini sensu lato South Africa]ACP30398.1 NADH dehydrogenase subunit 4L [Contracaecum rudolphii B Bullini et al., 1986]AOV63337.1 NADH dehydrogenase subunit 4L [Contracaecum ogmorhini sensu lato Australia]AOV63349.1 NADH dehydrogenase subunit 4L [Contracaecum ogmorh
MIFVFISSLSLIFKWQRLIFILISLEFIVMSLFIYFSSVLNEMMFFYFMCFSVISSVLGMVIMVGNMKFYGSDLCLF